MENVSVLSYFATRINTRFLRYITPEMLIAVCFVALLVVLLKEVFIDGFTTNVALNGTIAASFFYALYLVFRNNYSLYRLSKYIREIEEVEHNPNFNKEDVARLRDHLHRDGRLIDTQATYTVLSKMMSNGFFFPTDDDARVMKSTLGTRIRLRRGHISFLASILVTLGLIGTFWGLIITITSIGETMVGISKTFSADGGALDLGALISGISKPLGGMGVAFSSSLYGLAGSLVIGILSTLATKAQNNFIERFARWIDEHIPEINHELAERLAKEDELPAAVNQQQDDLIKAFVVLSQETHTQLRALGENIKGMVKVTEEELSIQQNIRDDLSGMKDIQATLADNITALRETHESTQQQAMSDSQQIISTLEDSKNTLDQRLETITNMQEETFDINKVIAKEATTSNANLVQLVTEQQSMQEVQKGLSAAVINTAQEMSLTNKASEATQSQLTTHFEKSGAKSDKMSKELERVNAQLTEAISHMNTNAMNQQELMAEKFSHATSSFAGNADNLNDLNSNFKEFSSQHSKHTEKLSNIIQSLDGISKQHDNTLSMFMKQSDELLAQPQTDVEQPIKVTKVDGEYKSLSESYMKEQKTKPEAVTKPIKKESTDSKDGSIYKKIKKQLTPKRSK